MFAKAVSSPVACLPTADFSSAKRSVSTKLTAPPRVFFGSSASFMPLGSVRRCVRASRFAGLVSKASPLAIAEAAFASNVARGLGPRTSNVPLS